MKNRVFIIVFALILAAAAASIYFFGRISSNEITAEIVQDGTVIKTINLNQITDTQDIIINSPGGGTNTVHIEPGAISISDADCPDRLCVKQGEITNGIYPIVCLPHKLVVRIVKDDEQTPPEVDAVTGR